MALDSSLPKLDMSDKRRDAAEAFARMRPYHAELLAIYEYYMPFRVPTQARSPSTGQGQGGERRTDRLFDATGVAAAMSFAGRMQADWVPANQEFFSLEAGPLVPKEDRPDRNKALQEIAEIVHATLPKAHVTVHEMMFDLFAGTGAMFFETGDEHEMIRGRAVPILEMAMDEGPWGDVWYRWWKRTYKLRDLEAAWPKGNISDQLAQAIRQDKHATTEIIQHTYYDPRETAWHLCVWSDKDHPENAIWRTRYRADPWVTPRLFKVPGETMGRGFAHLGMPFVKTANAVRELALKAAAFAIMGIWMYRDDGIFNPETARFDSMSFWPVSSTGGSFGPALARLPVPDNFDVSSVVMQDERAQIQRVLMDDELPDEQDPVRSATEIAGRLKRYARMNGGTGARLAMEMVVPLVQRAIDILEGSGKLPTGIKIDQMLVKANVIAPAAAAQRVEKVERAVNFIQMITMLLGPQAAMLVTEIETLLPQMGRWMGIEEQYLRSKGDVRELKGLVAELVAQQQQAKAGPPPPPTPQDVVNGAAGAF